MAPPAGQTSARALSTPAPRHTCASPRHTARRGQAPLGSSARPFSVMRLHLTSSLRSFLCWDVAVVLLPP